MPKLDHWTDSIPLITLMVAAFFVGCLTTTAFRDLEWETLAAGFLAILAGFFALKAAKLQTDFQKSQHENEIARLQKIDEKHFLQEMELLLIELNHTTKDVSDKLNTKQIVKLERYETEGLDERILPLKPPSTNEKMSFQYNQLRLCLKLLRRQLQVIEKADELKIEAEDVRQSAIKMANAISRICENFPKSNLVFPD
ncbi:hypothetical protein MACH10_13530 [Thalassospira tepidiphila]|uniref:hypothetical protein n=1 Tax=Thalassospira tepidiphila TaxID=393657 RepID=UPI00291D4EFE|nr:hypothetical protein MACH10_13530 [Thalassospira tepidiphila]